MKKLSPAQQVRLEYFRQSFAKFGVPIGSGEIENPKTALEKRTRKLVELGLLLYVGKGRKTRVGFEGGCGLIPAECFDESVFTKLEIGVR